MPPKPCHFFNSPGGCRKGDACNFVHDKTTSHRGQPLSPASPAVVGPGSNRATNGPSSTSSRRAQNAGNPPGVCSFFWKSGNCNREFECRFRHTRNPELDSSSQLEEITSQTAILSIAPFLTESGLAKLSVSGTDAFFASPTKPLTPSDAHNHLRKYLFDHFRFNKTFDVYGFLLPLSNASNSTWAPEDGQLLLNAIATGNGLLRIIDVLHWAPVSTQAGSHPQTLSFQRGLLPLIRFYSSDLVIKSTLSHLVNGLFMCIMNNCDTFCNHIESCMDAMVAAQSFNDPNAAVNAPTDPIGSQIIASLADIFFECLTRFKNSSATHPRLLTIVRRLQDWTNSWVAGICAIPPSFDDSFKDMSQAARGHIITYLKGKVERLVRIVDRAQAKLDRYERRTTVSPRVGTNLGSGILSTLQLTYDGPGELSRLGRPRHDNDYVYIQDIRVAPTHEELTCTTPPFLPANLCDAPHPLPNGSMERLLDIQYRLLREELTAPLRTAVQLVHEDLTNTDYSKKTCLDEIIKNRGGRYRGVVDRHESIMFNVYTGVEFLSLFPDRRGLSTRFSFDSPPGRARVDQPKARKSFWEGMSGKRMMQGGLIAIVWKRESQVDVYLGTLASSVAEVAESVTANQERVSARVVFFDPDLELKILHTLKDKKFRSTNNVIVLEAPVMFEAIRPFLEALKTEPESIPFGPCLVHHPPGFFATSGVKPPQYARTPGFAYQLAPLFPPGAGIDNFQLHVNDQTSIANARHALRQSRLDESQADAVVDALTREVALIQGPPGTGKSFTGVELLRVLIPSAKPSPVLVIAFTNHALDHLLAGVLDAGITNQIVRLGSRSADNRIKQYSIEELENITGRSRLNPSFARNHRDLKDVENQITNLMRSFTDYAVTSGAIAECLQTQYPEHFEHIYTPTPWISTVHALTLDDNTGWQKVGRQPNDLQDDDNTIYAFWLRGGDLEFLSGKSETPTKVVYTSSPPAKPSQVNSFDALRTIESPPQSSESEDTSAKYMDDSDTDASDLDDDEVFELVEDFWPSASSAQPDIIVPQGGPSEKISSPSRPPTTTIQITDIRDPITFFAANGHKEIPSIPAGNRPLDLLLDKGDIMWALSIIEREKLHSFWVQQTRELFRDNNLAEFNRLRKKYTNILEVYNEGKLETRRQLLLQADIVGCTTSGAAKLTSLLKGLDPRIMLVEEAGQVLEAHILGSLVPSVQHLILIGDPLQLRPTLNNYGLSMDSKHGSQLYKFDMSLMERLSSSGFPMSEINVQRRMRPTISNLIRKTLYPNLIDHDLVNVYPDVRGLARNVYFLSHCHRENGGGDESTSKYNSYEVDMIKDLVLYLLRQGCYSQEGDIVVLCAYLGQLSRVRDALSGVVAVVIDERDRAELADQEGEHAVDLLDDSHVEHVKVSQRVRLRTVDNYQGEEAKIVILSLVRNAGSIEDGGTGRQPTIGFLKSDNRTNVALSRAKEGLFILGNAPQLAARSDLWRGVIQQLEQEDCIGDGFLVACHQHPDAVKQVSQPGQLPQYAPDGGCLKSCDARLDCGHVCPYKCHPDDPGHLGVVCSQICRRLCPRRHPCNKECAVPCGDCKFKVPDVELPCGHISSYVLCCMLDKLEDVICDALVHKQLLTCEHSAELRCSDPPSLYKCARQCSGIMECCGRTCNSKCHDCQLQNESRKQNDSILISRTAHVQHPCRKSLHCAHLCNSPCSEDHKCVSACKEQCRQECAHARCNKYCASTCSPCQEPCTWKCSHFTCPLPCGSVCARLPCDERCKQILGCGHQCPSICGEDCSIQICPFCAPLEDRGKDVDLILGRTLADIKGDGVTLDEVLITLPKCRHVFTVETLDGICGMGDYYVQRERKKPPVCPTCRSAITSPRYSRVYKSADLDILERNVISRMSAELAALLGAMTNIPKSEIESTLIASAPTTKMVSEPLNKKIVETCKGARKAFLKTKSESPTPSKILVPGNQKFFNIPLPIVAAWNIAVQPYLRLYDRATKIAEMRSAHIKAWEAAWSCLYQQEIEFALANPQMAPRNLNQYAMRAARMKVGQPEPRADKRFVVEAFWLTIEARLILSHLSLVWLKEIGRKSLYTAQQAQMWVDFGVFLLRSCQKDVHVALEIASTSESRHQMTTTSLLMMRVDLELFRFQVGVAGENGAIKSSELRSKLADSASKAVGQVGIERSRIVKAHLRVLPDDDKRWIPDNFLNPVDIIHQEWQKLEKSIRTATVYEPVSLDEKLQVVKALGFGYSGHFYNCPNGHTFTIGECGGAMERARCPECGEVIGGSDHTLEGRNTRASEFEDLARREGALLSPFAWGRNE